ncbi:Gpi-anchored protein [Thalictrum thalictroides]|uniref:Gpi-anchored protein n=1 Tax=Thalictrum thalictroides TaxID=46969 RepID=A0A7J6X5Y1_THATH|nr:Gpi-anchored protein [Thalictrum thalictroides]
MPQIRTNVFFLLFFLLHIPYYLFALPVLPEPDPSAQRFLPTPSTPATISAFPEQSDLASCPLDLPNELFHGISNACSGKSKSGELSRNQCCPVLAAWLYSAYASTALGRAGRMSASTPYDLPVLPEDSESCVDNLEKALTGKGIELRKPNETCDVVFCYCNIRLHPFSCPEAFTVSKEGKLVGDKSVKMLEKDCLNHNKDHLSLSRCSKCLHRLYQLKEEDGMNRTRKTDRKSKMHSRDCELMGLTWLLSKNRTAYIHTVSAVLRALMISSTDGSDPQSCSLASDGMPLAVDSAELDNKSPATKHSYMLSTCMIYLFSIVIYTMFL